jgi:hypothetical protein
VAAVCGPAKHGALLSSCCRKKKAEGSKKSAVIVTPESIVCVHPLEPNRWLPTQGATELCHQHLFILLQRAFRGSCPGRAGRDLPGRLSLGIQQPPAAGIWQRLLCFTPLPLFA